jgi:thiamine-phosphate pyrophosphorylase
MTARCLLYYITDRSAFSGDESARRAQLLNKIAEAAANAVDYIQLREKDLSGRQLESLASEAMRVIRERSKAVGGRQSITALLINSRTDVALSVCAAGVHLRSIDVSPREVRDAWKRSREEGQARGEKLRSNPTIGVSCHSPQDVNRAASSGADFAVFGPVFGKKDSTTSATAGLEALRQACETTIPVLALGGVTLENAESCLNAGAAGIAGVRLFQENDISKVVQRLRG